MPTLASLAKQEEYTVSAPSNRTAASSLTISLLTGEHQSEVLTFLSHRPLHTVAMVSMIQDNGLLSPLNRGTFYACRNKAGQLEGVALIGHATLLETRTEAALQVFAELARGSQHKHLIMGEQDKIEQFWNYYAGVGQDSRHLCRELLFEQKWPVQVLEAVRGLRPATLDDLELVMPVQARMAFEESGINPMEVDPTGFRLRCARRIEQGRVWVWVEQGRLIFKADIIAESPQVSYLEGVYTNPEERGKGYGLRCVSQLSRTLLARTASVCLFVNEKNREAQEFYLRAGYKLRSYYDTIFLQQ
jgi:predicted GNAT family acetyltransferase